MARNRKPAVGGNQPRPQVAHQVPQIISQQITAGPIPSAQEFEYYEHVLPGAADRILAMAEANQARRHESEAMADASNQKLAAANAEAVLASARASDEANNEARRSQWMAYSIVVVFTASAFTLAILGKEITASVLGGGVLVALVTTFLRKKTK